MISEGYFASEVIPRELGLDSDFNFNDHRQLHPLIHIANPSARIPA
jgi:hypothetical protein